MSFETRLDTFEGPLDLLLHLIEKNKIDIYDIPIADITDQYLEYVAEMKRNDAEVMSEFLVMAATLLDIKAKMLLPDETGEDAQEEDPRADLVRRLLEYKLCKYMSAELKDRSVEASKMFYKQADIPEEVAVYRPPVDLDVFLGDITLSQLKSVFDDVMARSRDKINTEAMKFGRIQKDEVKIEDRMAYIKKCTRRGKTLSFRKLLEANYTKTNVIVTFLAVLELMKTGEISAKMDGAEIVLGPHEETVAEAEIIQSGSE